MRKGSAVVPWSGSHLRSYSCCNVFFPCEETGLASSGYITDIIGGVQYQPSLDGDGGTIANGSGTTVSTVRLLNGVNNIEAPLKAGRWPDWGTKSILNIAVCRVNTLALDGESGGARFKIPMGIGDGTGSDISVSWQTSQHILVEDDATHQATTSILAPGSAQDGKDLIVTAVLDRVAGTVYTDTFNLDGTTAIARLSTSTNVSLLGNIHPPANCRATGMKLYGWAGFSFTNGIPSDYKNALLWLAADWTSKSINRYLYPGWRYTT